jgi:hypothetical protein
MDKKWLPFLYYSLWILVIAGGIIAYREEEGLIATS